MEERLLRGSTGLRIFKNEGVTWVTDSTGQQRGGSAQSKGITNGAQVLNLSGREVAGQKGYPNRKYGYIKLDLFIVSKL